MLILGVVVYCLGIVGMRWKRRKYGYNYGNIVLDGEWWRLAASALSHPNAGHANLSIIGLLLSSLADEARFHGDLGSVNFVCSMFLLSFLCQILTLGCVRLAISLGLSASEFSAEPHARGADTHWLAHGSLAPALARLACSADSLTERPQVLIVLLILAAQITAPNEPVLPNVLAWFLGFLLTQLESFDSSLHSTYWAGSTLVFLLFLSLCSLKSTRPHLHLPGISYSNLPGPANNRPTGDNDFHRYIQELADETETEDLLSSSRSRRARHHNYDHKRKNSDHGPDGAPRIIIIDGIVRDPVEGIASAFAAAARRVESESLFSETDTDPPFFFSGRPHPPPDDTQRLFHHAVNHHDSLDLEVGHGGSNPDIYAHSYDDENNLTPHQNDFYSTT